MSPGKTPEMVPTWNRVGSIGLKILFPPILIINARWCLPTILPGLNHFFQTAVTGSPVEYSRIDESLSPAALQTVGDWIEEKIKDPDNIE